MSTDDLPAGALRRLEEIRDLIFKAKVEDEESTIYVVDGSGTQILIPSFVKFKLTAAANLVGNTVFFNTPDPERKKYDFHDHILLPAYSVGGGHKLHRYIFTNYFHAWACYHRMKQRRDELDQQALHKEVFSQRA